jgi:hypothetical protein
MGPVWPPDRTRCKSFISVSCFGDWLNHDGPQILEDGTKLFGGCVAGAVYGEQAIDSPVGYSVALVFGPEQAVLLPLYGCVGGTLASLVEIEIGYEGPNPFETALP